MSEKLLKIGGFVFNPKLATAELNRVNKSCFGDVEAKVVVRITVAGIVSGSEYEATGCDYKEFTGDEAEALRWWYANNATDLVGLHKEELQKQTEWKAKRELEFGRRERGECVICGTKLVVVPLDEYPTGLGATHECHDTCWPCYDKLDD